MASNEAKSSGGIKANTTQIPPKRTKKASPLANGYLLLYNSTSLALWGTLTARLCLLLFPLALGSSDTRLSSIYDTLFPLVRTTQSLALLEILHSLFGLVRASVVTTAMQVASRIVVVWGVMHLFPQTVGAEDGILGGGGEAKLGDWGFIGCLTAWGVTECIRYGFFTLQLSGLEAPKWLLWLRYNTFFVLYPLGISSECLLMYLAISPAPLIHFALPWAFMAILAIYVPGSYVLYTHMMAQRRKVMKTAKRVD